MPTNKIDSQNPDPNYSDRPPAPGDGEVISESSASQGQKTGHIRWVLAVSFVATAVVFVAVILWARASIV